MWFNLYVTKNQSDLNLKHQGEVIKNLIAVPDSSQFASHITGATKEQAHLKSPKNKNTTTLRICA